MRLTRFKIKKFRSIEEVEISFPEKKPVILFGPNNVGKSNILLALDIMLGEKHASYYDFEESDFFMRDKDENPNICFTACFDQDYYSGNNYNPSTKEICFTTNKQFSGKKESSFHYKPETNSGGKIFLSNEDKEKCQVVLIDATRDINKQLSYFSKYTILSKMAKKMHKAMQSSVKSELDTKFLEIKQVFESVPEYKAFHEKLQAAFQSNIDGFEHKLEIDLSACDPNNYFNSLKIVAKQGDTVCSFDEFGTGEQQVLLLSFVKAYAETFKGETFILGIEEPEAHLHPIAQRWLSKNISEIAKSNVQIIISTHSPEFLDIENLDGFVKVYKNEHKTKIIQHTTYGLVDECVKLGVASQLVNPTNILTFYKTKTFYDQLRGFFARKIILVEGQSELFSIPNYFKNCGYCLVKNGVEIINCRGKAQIPRDYRLFKSYQYDCFCLFDADISEVNNSELAKLFGFNADKMKTLDVDFEEGTEYGYFGKDYESYMRTKIPDYQSKETAINSGKIINAKIISEQNCDIKPAFIDIIAQKLNLIKEE